MRTFTRTIATLFLVAGTFLGAMGQYRTVHSSGSGPNAVDLVEFTTGSYTLNSKSSTGAYKNISSDFEAAFASNIPGLREAESMDNALGVGIYPCTDIGAGSCAGSIDNGDWMDYIVTSSSATTYSISFRVATIFSGQQFQIKNGATVLQTVAVPNTGDWQGWQTVTVNQALPAGTYTLRIASVSSGGWNLNWINFSTSAGPQPPTANAGSNQTITLPTTSVSLSGSGVDPDGTVTGYAWTNISGPITPTITSPGTAATNVTGLTTAGTYVIRLTVTDNTALTGISDVTITVNNNTTPPSITTNNPQSITGTSASFTSTPSTPFSLTSTRWTKFSVPGQSMKRITVVGSSTSAGNGATTPDSSFVGRLKTYYKAQGIIDTIYNLSVPSTTVFDVSITAALNKGAPVLLVNYPSNGFDGSTFTIAQIMNKFQEIADSCTNRGVQFYTTGTQPRNDFSPADRARLNVINDSLRNRFGARFIDFMKPVLKTLDNTIMTEYSFGDGIHVNNAGHERFYSIVRATNVFQNTISSPSVITSPNSTSTSATGLTLGVHRFQISIVDARGLAASAVAQVTITSVNAPNAPPVAKAGNDQTINTPTSSVSLDGTASTDDHNIIAYQWTKLAGSTGAGGTFSTPTQSTTNFTGLSAGTYLVELRITDDSSAIGRDTVLITVSTNKPIPGQFEAESYNNMAGVGIYPATDAGGGSCVGSIDNGDWMDYTVFVAATATYTFSFRVATPNNGAQFQVKLGNTVLQTINVPNTGDWQGWQTVTAQVALTAGTQTLRIWSAGSGWNLNWISSSLPVNQLPVAKAGNDQTITLPVSSVSLSGTASTDDHPLIAYQWTKLAASTGAGGTFGTPTASTTTFTGLSAGLYYVELRVTDDSSAIARDTVLITVNPPLNVPPVAHAGNDQTITMPVTSVSLSGTTSTDDHNIIAYQWTKLAMSTGTGGTFGTATASTTNFTGLSAGTYYVELRVTDDSSAVGRDTVLITVNPPLNTPPVAHAGNDQTITMPVTSVSLSGTTSTDDHNIITYQWTKLPASTGAGGTFGTPGASTTNFTGLSAGTYQVELKVTDDSTAIGRDTVIITVNPPLNTPPVAHAGNDQSITLPTNSVSLDGTTSTDDHNITGYQWTQIPGGTGVGGSLTTPTSSTTTFTGLSAGTYFVELAVTDDSSAVSRDTVKITVSPNAPNVAPVAHAGNDQTITMPVTSVSLSGTTSTDDHNIIAYQWTKLAASTGAGGTFGTPALSTTNFTGLSAGIYYVELMVTDDSTAVGRDTVMITVNPPLNVPPVAHAGNDQTITMPVTSVSLSGTTSTDDHNIIAYQWTKLAMSTGTGGTFGTATASTTNFTGLSAGKYYVELRVTDDSTAVGRDTVMITVNPPLNIPPVAHAGNDQTITMPVTSVSLSGTTSTDDHNIIAYQWTKLGLGTGTGGTFGTPALSTTNFTGLSAGTYYVELRVTDDSSAIGRDTVIITVNPPLNVPPVARAGNDQVIALPANSVTLNGTTSSDDHNIIAYQWTKIGGGTGAGGTITTPTLSTTTFTGLGLGTYFVELRVTDDSTAIGRDTIKITVTNPPNTPPVANAGPDQTIQSPVTSVTLSGSGSTDDHNITGYLWTKLTGTGGTITTPTAVTTTFTGLTTGVYTVELRVTDDSSAVKRDTVQVTVLAGSIIDPNDILVTYNPSSPPPIPPAGVITDWVRTQRMTWSTTSWKAYYLSGTPFRIKFPKTYVPGVNDGKKYPMMIFLHGLGETGTIYDNEFSMANGGPVFNDVVNNGTYDGYIMIAQAPGGGWASSHLALMVQIANYMVQYNKLDPFRIVDNGLSNGGYACWDQVFSPSFLAARMPMSGIGLSNIADTTFNMFTPIWDFQGGLDAAPDPNNALAVKNAYDAAGANMKYTLYPNLGHGTWSTAWSEPDFFPYALRAYSSNPWPKYGRTEFCQFDPINVTIGVPPGFDNYQWRRNGVLINGATTNTILATDTGTYDARVLKGINWSDWSRIPVHITIKLATITPPITVSGLMSKVIPALDTNNVTLKVPSGYQSYLWQRVGNSTTLSTDSTLNVSSPGDYIVKVSEYFGCASAFSAPFKVVDATGNNKPDAATSLGVTTMSNTSLKLDWNQNPTPQFNETNFEIYQSAQSGGPYKLVAITGADVSTYTVSGLSIAGTNYYFKVRAVNNNGAAAASNEAVGTTSADILAPTAPTNLSVAGSTRSSISLTWDASTDDVGVVIYEVYINGVRSYTTTQTNYTINELVYPQSYNFKVRAKDFAGNASPLSNQVTGQPLLKNINWKYYTFEGNWPVLPNFAPLIPDATGIATNVDLNTVPHQEDNFAVLWEGYIVIPTTGTYRFRINSDDGSKLWLGSLNGTSSPYNYGTAATVSNDGQHGGQDSTSNGLSLTAGIYPIAIAFFEQGGGQQMILSWRTPATGTNYEVVPNSAFNESPVNNGSAPTEPSQLAATGVSYKQINLTWTDNSNNETGFEVWRSTNIATGFEIVGTTAANATSFGDSLELSANTTYYYKLRAIGQFGESAFIPQNDAEANWKFNNDYNDASSNGHTLSANNSPTFNSSDKKEGTHSVDLNGSNEDITVNTSSGDYLRGGYSAKTVSFWMRADATSGSTKYGIFDFGGSDDGLGMYITGNTLNAGVASNDTRRAISSAYSSTAWNYITLVYSTNTLRLYVNGVNTVSNTSLGFTSVGTTSNASMIGDNNDATAFSTSTTFFDQFDGRFDDFRIFDRALTQTEITALMNGTYELPVPATTLALPSIPAAPTALSDSVISTNSMKIKWTENANNETGLELYRSANNNTNYLLLVTLPANSVNYTDTTLFANATYYYKVRAINAGGASAYSNEASATTKNHAPVIVDLVNRSARYGITTIINVSGTDQDGEALAYTIQNKPAFITFTDNGNQTATLTLNPAITDQGVYNNIRVIVNDQHGGKDTTTFNLTVNDNYDPALDSVGDYVLSENTVINIPLHATDQNPANTLVFSVSNLPNAFVLTPGSNGNATLQLSPTYTAAGIYTVQVDVSDGNGGTASRQFTLTVNDVDPSTKIYTRVKYANNIGAPWNNLNGLTTNNLVDDKNTTTTVGVNFLNNFWLPYNAGPITGNNSGVYPDAVLNDFWYFGYFGGPETASLAVTGLNPARKYNLTFYAGSVFNGFADNGTTNYTVGATTVSLYVQNNTQNTVTIYDIIPAANGTITVNMAKAAGTPIGYLNAMVITDQYNDGTVPAIPNPLTGVNVPGQGPKLTWKDVAYNETGYEIYRSLSAGGTYTLAGTAQRNTTTFTDGTAAGSTTYFYKVRGINSIGASGYTNIVSLLTTNRVPTINPISDVVVLSNQSVNVNVTAIDDATDHITLTATGLPSFATFTDNGNGTGVVHVTPTASSLGAYNGIVITAKDNSDSSRSTSFNIFVVDANITSTYVDITEGTNMSVLPWNNFAIGYQPTAGLAMTNLKDDRNATTSVAVTLTDAWANVSITGMRRRNGSELYPESVSRSGIYFTDNATHRITVTGLNPAKKYNFVFYSSHNTSESTLTNFNIGANTVSLNGCHNSNKTVQLNGIVPPANGTVVINVTKNASALSGLLSAMIIQSYTPAFTPVIGPTDLRVLDYITTANAIALQWQDRADNETGYEVWRSTDGNSYSLLTTLAANTTSYTNTTLAANTNYWYQVRAKTASATSPYSNPVAAHTYNTVVYVNVTSNAQAAAPWNNLNWIYGLGAVWTNFKNEAGIPTNIGMLQPVKIDGMIGGGVNTGNNSGVFPDGVLAESFGLFPGLTSYVKLTGLNQSRLYDITLTASATGIFGDNSTQYTINGKTCLLNSIQNKDGSLTMFNILPDINGEVKISFTTLPGATWALMGAIVVKGYTPPAGTIPSGRQVQQYNYVPAEESEILIHEEETTNVVAESKSSTPVTGVAVALKEITAYPNPFDKDIMLSVPAENNDIVDISVSDISGKVIFQTRYDYLDKGVNNIKLLHNFSKTLPGIYFVKVTYVGKGVQQTVKLLRKP